ARAAPSRPEIQDHDSAFVLSQLVLAAVEQVQLERWRRLTDQGRFQAGRSAIGRGARVALDKLWLDGVMQSPCVIRQLGGRLFDERPEQQLIHVGEVRPAGAQYVARSRDTLLI